MQFFTDLQGHADLYIHNYRLSMNINMKSMNCPIVYAGAVYDLHNMKEKIYSNSLLFQG